MTERNWEQEARQNQENLENFERRQASILHNPQLAKLYIERGVAIALVVVFTSYGSTLQALGHVGRNLFFGCTLLGTLVAIALVAIGSTCLVYQKRQQDLQQKQATPLRDNVDSSAIGW